MRLCVFCGASPGARPGYGAAARTLGRMLAARGIGLVTGGGQVGLMGIVADAALDAGGEVIGVIPRSLEARELAHRGLTALHVTETMHARKALMAELSDAFAALPGGIGTLDEVFECWTWWQLGLHAKPVALLDVDNYFAPLIGFLDHQVAERFVDARTREALIVEREPDALLDRVFA